MTRLHSEHILKLDQPLTWFDQAIEWVLAATLLFTPMAFGTMEAWSQQIFFVAVAVMALLMTARQVMVRQSRFVWTWAYVPIVAYLLLVALSIIPLPASVLNVISPGTVSEKSRLLADLPNASELTRVTTISFNTHSSAYGLRILLALTVVFVVVINTFRTAAQIKRLLAIIVIAGTLVTLLTLAQDLTFLHEPTKIFWYFSFEPAPHYGAGPFIGHAQIGQYLNLVVGAAIALALVQIGETFQGEDLSGREILERLTEPGVRVVSLLVLLMAMAAGAIVLAASRGALAGLAVASLVTVILLLRKRGWREGETAKVIAALVAFVVLGGAVFVFVALPKLQKSVETAGITGTARLEILRKVPAMVARWPLMGTGMESFEWVYPMFQDTDAPMRRDISDHAENDYAQTLTDTGVLGFAAVIAFLAILITNWVRAQRGSQPIHLASIGIAFSLLAILVHETADFAQRTPAVGLVTTLLVGITFSLVRLGEPHPVEAAAPKFGFNPLPRLAGGLVMVAALAWVIWSNYAVYMGEKYYYVSDPLYTGNIDRYDPKADAALVAFFQERIAGCEQALQYDPTSLHYRHYLNEFRWRLLSRRRDPQTWNVIWPADAKQQAEKIVDELSAARVLCPTFGRLYILQGMVQWSLLDKAEGKKNLLHGYELMPIDGEVNYNMTEVALAEGRWDDAVKFARDTLARHIWYDYRLMYLVLKKYKNSDIAFRIFEGDGHGLHLLSVNLPPEEKALHRQVTERSIELLTEATKKNPNDGAALYALAQQLDAIGRKAEAADAVALALRSDYANVDWRLYRARLLRDLGKRNDALAELDIIRRMRPQSDEAKAMQTTLMSPRGQ